MEKIVINEALVGKRLDKALTEILNDKSRSYVGKLIEEDKVLVNDIPLKASYILKKDDVISYNLLEPTNLEIEGQNLNLEIVYEDDDVAVVNKPKGMVVHPAAGNYDNTLVNGLLYEMNNLSTINGVVRPGIVHRIDKDTTGLLMIAKNDKASLSLTEQLKQHKCKRIYQALVYGTIIENRGKINAPIARSSDDRKKMAVSKIGKNAVTNFTVLKRYKNYTLIECQLETGRTHQIRVHLAYSHLPIVGDVLYGHKTDRAAEEGQCLHAFKLSFNHPITHEHMTFYSPVDEYFKKQLRRLCQ